MKMNFDGAEIDSVLKMKVYGDWIKFVDREGSTIKITPGVVKQLLVFALENISEFEAEVWE